MIFNQAHALPSDTRASENTGLDQQLESFWESESLGDANKYVVV